MTRSSLKLGTRGSALALWQANYVADRLRPVVSPRRVELVRIETHGDRDQANGARGAWGVGESLVHDERAADCTQPHPLSSNGGPGIAGV